MILSKTPLYYLMGLFAGLFICNQTIKTVFRFDLIYLYFFVLVFISSLIYIGKLIKGDGKLSKQVFISISFFSSILIYACVSTYYIESPNYTNLFEILACFILFFSARCVNKDSLKVIVFVVLLFSVIQSSMLILNRSYLYSSGINYLLMSFVVALSTCICVPGVLLAKSIKIKILFIVIALINWVGLLSMQSRAAFIFAFFYLIISPLFLLTNKSKAIYIATLSLLGMLIFSYFYKEIIEFYQNSAVYARMFDLISNFENEPRLDVYGRVYNSLGEFYLTGYGLGETTPNLYKYTKDKYPHNFILEFWTEFGFLGLFFSLWLLFIGVKSCFFLNFNKYYNAVAVTMYLFFLMNFMKSFTIYDSAILFFLTGVICTNIRTSSSSASIYLKESAA
ncbi:hypothetical protein FX988_03699 [Paraglaciecola mesophila]|uniref:O-antigen ligase-related domain-containing protein n=1 Tax=Paraglaciecola mesophila TaxID=197222 RepID=A0A857JPX2_9ALTE|nr:O-antigen ligase family protein [Paraglaciecola mesophila]QHJ13438.1 hypothetical protein FX988_03699 [Paraglaciecola mesophila]